MSASRMVLAVAGTGCCCLLGMATALLASRVRRRLVRRRRLACITPAPSGDVTPWWVQRGVSATACGAAAAATAGWLVGGPVAATVGLGYGAVAVRACQGRFRRRAAGQATTRALDGVVGLAADLRAGLAPGAALTANLPRLPGAAAAMSGRPPVRRGCDGRDAVAGEASPEARLAAGWVAASWELAETTGAPLADLLDRLDADLRAVARARRSALAQASGVRTTAVLLAVLPFAGLALGFAVGADPVRILLHTRAGGACALAAVLLQLAGLAWSNHLIRRVEETR